MCVQCVQWHVQVTDKLTAGTSRVVGRALRVASKPPGPHRLRRLASLGPRLERQGHAEREPSREALYTPTMSVVIPKQREARYSVNVPTQYSLIN